MNILKALSLNKGKIIASEASKPQEICWEAKFASRQIDLSTQVVVEEGQLALMLINQTIKAILESGSFPLSWIFDEEAEEDLNSLRVYFFTTKTFSDQRWGTPTPIVYQDPEKGMISLRAHGTFSYSIDNPKKLWRHIPLDQTPYTTLNIIDELRSLILNEFTVTLNNANPQLPKLMSQRKEFAEMLMNNLAQAFFSYGLKLSSFLIQSISLPEETSTNNTHFSKIEKLNELYRQGILTEEEYQEKKKLLLKDI